MVLVRASDPIFETGLTMGGQKRQRSTWCNVWHSSAIRSTLYTLGAPARAVKGLVERHRAVA
jgi:hypothetical protein